MLTVLCELSLYLFIYLFRQYPSLECKLQNTRTICVLFTVLSLVSRIGPVSKKILVVYGIKTKMKHFPLHLAGWKLSKESG